MNNRRLSIFIAVICVLLVGVAANYFLLGGTDRQVCPPGTEASREYTTNKTRKLTCTKVD